MIRIKMLGLGLLVVLPLTVVVVSGQEEEGDKTMQQAMEAAQKAAAKQGIKVPNNPEFSKQLQQIDEENGREAKETAAAEAKKKASTVTSPLTALPDWMPKIPDFKTAGKGTRSQADGREEGKMTGTCSAKLDDLANTLHDWAIARKFGFERQDSNINGRKTTDIHMMDINGGTLTEVRVELTPAKATGVKVEYNAPVAGLSAPTQ